MAGELELEGDVDVDVSHVSIEEKLAAVLLCFAGGGAFTVKSVRECACRYVSVGDRMVGHIVRFLASVGLVVYSSRKRKWVASLRMPRLGNFGEALSFAFELSESFSSLIARIKQF